ncbi:MAG: anti-sigma F factor [Clostridia bacterium]|jgi:stage II sporulation protein AB (anti-sigma F factor)|nr:anti-sigma F factor [Clostridia bacterium]
MNNFMTLKIKAVSRNESFARSAVAAFCVELNPTLDDLSDIKTAVSEAVTNSIVHGYDGEDGVVTIQAGIDGNVIHIEVSDEGKGIEDISMARQPFYTTKPDAERSGMGFTVMESFMDTLEVFHNAPHGTVVKMSKNLCAVK